ncbi:MAG: aminoacyl-histidine dipeptidase [Lachnospiraceae bacterium]|nr:aminoacyl-histidine dipeptidase [Lachnospiraceae bacterium]
MLEHLQPKAVFSYFEEICNIPHGSYNTSKISDYLVDFAKQRNLWYTQDEVGNVIIVKEATAGFEDKEPVIIQGHMDMVAVKEDDCTKDMLTEGLDLVVDGDFISAKGTSLGGDDGIAVAYALAILDSDEIAHPRLEVVITIDEEVGMDGAMAIDLSCLKGHTLLNIDSEKETELTVACAGGVNVAGQWQVNHVETEGAKYKVMLTGLSGGHSGVEIHKGRANANKLMIELLYLLEREVDISLCSLHGGTADNVIPFHAEAEFLCKKDFAQVEGVLRAMEEVLRSEWEKTDPGLQISVTELEKSAKEKTMETTDFFRLLSFFLEAPNGVQEMSKELEGVVETSLNFGTISYEQEGCVKAGFLIRSSVDNAKHALASKIRKMIKESQGSCTKSGEYPGWSYRVDSPLREKMVRIYKEHFDREPAIISIHAGLECGILAEKIPNLDAVSMGPDMYDIHTTEERLSISSTQRVWEYLLKILAQ